MIEIERKFLVKKDWKPSGKGLLMKQGYLSVDPERTVRVRIAGEDAFLTVKGKTTGISRMEFEYPIPIAEAEKMLAIVVHSPIEKRRYTESINGLLWEIDIFFGANKGLILAEVELKSEDQTIVAPEWVLEEVSTDHRFYNSYLSQNPYSDW